MSIGKNCADSTVTLTTFPAGSVEEQLLRQYVSYCEAVATEFRCNVLSEYPTMAKHLTISMFLEEKRLVATLIRDKARVMSGEDKTSCFWGAYLYWCDALSVIAWLTSQLNHAKPR